MKKIMLFAVIISCISCKTKQEGVFHATEKYFDSLPYEFKLKLDSQPSKSRF